MKQGKILIAPFTQPHWDILFPMALGIITETGTMLSHPVIKASEYGIPALIGVGNATRIVKDGDIVKIDGRKRLLIILKQ